MNGNDATSASLAQHTPDGVFNVAVLGAESTGKTTLCQDLAAHFGCPWVPEYMRTYLQKKWDERGEVCTWEDLLPIAAGQIDSENNAAAAAVTHGQHVFCDTSLTELFIYSHWYYGDCPEPIKRAVQTHHYDAIIVTEVDIPWVADDLRDSPHLRAEMYDYFIHWLDRLGLPYLTVGGSREARVARVAAYIAEQKRRTSNF